MVTRWAQGLQLQLSNLVAEVPEEDEATPAHHILKRQFNSELRRGSLSPPSPDRSALNELLNSPGALPQIGKVAQDPASLKTSGLQDFAFGHAIPDIDTATLPTPQLSRNDFNRRHHSEFRILEAQSSPSINLQLSESSVMKRRE